MLHETACETISVRTHCVSKVVRGPPYLGAHLSFAPSHKFLVVHPCIVDPIKPPIGPKCICGLIS